MTLLRFERRDAEQSPLPVGRRAWPEALDVDAAVNDVHDRRRLDAADDRGVVLGYGHHERSIGELSPEERRVAKEVVRVRGEAERETGQAMHDPRRRCRMVRE